VTTSYRGLRKKDRIFARNCKFDDYYRMIEERNWYLGKYWRFPPSIKKAIEWSFIFIVSCEV